MFEGNTADSSTVESQLNKLKECFELAQLILVGDRGLLPEQRISETLKPTPGIDWITALRSEQVRQLFEMGVLQEALFEIYDGVDWTFFSNNLSLITRVMEEELQDEES